MPRAAKQKAEHSHTSAPSDTRDASVDAPIIPNAMRVKVLVLPVYRRAWLYHAWVPDQGGAVAHVGPWYQAGSTVQEKLHVLSSQVNAKVGAGQGLRKTARRHSGGAGCS